MFFSQMQQLISQHHWHSSHEGMTPTGQNLDEFLVSTYDNNFLPFFNKILAVYGAEYLSILNLNCN
jgi:hypothetical protein